MSGNKTVRPAPPLRVAGRPVAARLRAIAPALTRRIVARLQAELPAYAELPGEEVAGDVADIVQHSVRAFADAVEARATPTATALGPQRDSAAARAEEGVPLDAILTAYQLGIAMCWDEVAADARPADLADVKDLMVILLSLQRELTSAVSGGYLAARRILDAEENGGRHALLAALLAGEPLDRADPRPAARYVAMTLAIAPHPDEGQPGARARIAARRKLRRVRAVLDGFAGEPSLAALDGTGGTVLLPVGAVPEWAQLCCLLDRTTEAAGVVITAAACVTEPAGVPAAVAQTARIVDLVARTGRPPGLYRLADVLLDYQLSRPSAALAGLAELLDPLAHKPELLRTLDTYLRADRDRRRTAAQLHVHPNTVDYRIRRITELTGLSPGRIDDVQYLHAALIARRMTG